MVRRIKYGGGYLEVAVGVGIVCFLTLFVTFFLVPYFVIYLPLILFFITKIGCWYVLRNQRYSGIRLTIFYTFSLELIFLIVSLLISFILSTPSIFYACFIFSLSLLWFASWIPILSSLMLIILFIFASLIATLIPLSARFLANKYYRKKRKLIAMNKKPIDINYGIPRANSY
ncbi:MAG: hypothetical protein HC907_30060 [Richelia sp. SM1_7_0]|nr:hypothetical protein [Richelia sp. SM1_7_0]NJR19187.1 hypothetical protein [Calothrix sp. CSU_2_0]